MVLELYLNKAVVKNKQQQHSRLCKGLLKHRVMSLQRYGQEGSGPAASPGEGPRSEVMCRPTPS